MRFYPRPSIFLPIILLTISILYIFSFYDRFIINFRRKSIFLANYSVEFSRSNNEFVYYETRTTFNEIFDHGNESNEIHVALVVCGENRTDTVFTALKSILIFSSRNSTNFTFHVFADESAKAALIDEISRWKEVISWKTFHIQIYALHFPTKNQATWINLFRRCASQRLFIPNILTDVDSLIYIDTDIIFLRRIEDLWHYFTKFNDTQISGLVAESEDSSTNWYNRFAKHPYVKPLGVNSGVMLMNLTRMRNFHWNSRVEWTFNRYKTLITWGDQDLINVIFSQYKDKLFMIGCEWNYRPDHCMYSPACRSAASNGISIIHGNRDYFRSSKNTPFKILYEVTKEKILFLLFTDQGKRGIHFGLCILSVNSIDNSLRMFIFSSASEATFVEILPSR